MACTRYENHVVHRPAFTSSFAISTGSSLVRTLPGFFPGKNSVSTINPCSRSSIPSAAASRNPIEHRCPVTFAPRLCAAVIAAAKLSVRDEHVCLEIVDALVEPEVHGSRRVVGPGQLVQSAAPTIPCPPDTAR